ncbi:ABC transporter ATP-binding protein [Ktedonospora formicarum]|uniref:ABC transporter ATP-binding protein n=1 Tax=Ktedonospora formicarum TaxID=2778364 RepID=A0A8J3MVN1_9CHLR|nr:ABC transporter ATP-binding protein [Ktedonospora formicarum]GHO47833.1 ABC transporter ATP-binding protein [Ktedonospora formicarum]
MSITIENVSKNYSSVQALKGITLHIEDGMFGLLGPNGAGKTTLLRILATLIRPSSGQITIDEYNVLTQSGCKAIRSQLGYLPQELAFYPDLTGREFLDYMGLLKRLYDRPARRKQMDALLDVVSLSAVADHKVKTYSGGMKRRLGIAQALLGNPRLLIVDEPTAGLDPEERIRLRTLLSHLAHRRVVLLSTHVVEDISQTCRHIAVLNKGEVAFQGLTYQITKEAQDHVWQFRTDTPYTPSLEQSTISVLPQEHGTLYRIVGPRPTAQNITDLQAVAPSLEDGYIWLQQRHTLSKRTPTRNHEEASLT